MILIALGSNMPSPAGPPMATLEAALVEMARRGIGVFRRSRWYESPPDPPSDQARYVNGVVAVETGLGAEALLATLHAIEAQFGRVRSARNEPRTLDLDLLDYDGRVVTGGTGPCLPHPRLAGRAFVLHPLSEVAPGWRHPVTRRPVAELIAALPASAVARPLPVAAEKS